MSVFAKAKASRSKSLKSVLGGIAMVGVGALVLAGCTPTENPDGPSGPTEQLTLKIGTLLPQTGSLSFLGPPEEAGVALAAKEINEANLGITVEITYGDSGDPDNKAYATAVPTLLSAGVSAIIGAAASGVSKLVIDQITGAGVIQISPANTSPDFTTWDDDGLYWRTAPSDLLQGEVLGNLVAEEGASSLGMIVINDAYGTGLEKVTAETFENAGGTVVATEYFNDGDTNFSAQISTVLAQDPDAIALITFDQAYTILPALKDQGYDMSKVYLVDGNTKQFGADLPAGTVEGATGMAPGPSLADDFQDRLNDAWQTELDGAEPLSDFLYAAESYDAVMLLALAALAAGSTDGADIAAKLQEVSGGGDDPGEKATDFASAAQIILDGGKVDYDGYSGGIKFDDAGDPTDATIGIFKYGADNMHTRTN
ncbi:ABC transporter substrate-binding protein [Cryobacterium sp. BB736]|uniref:ABC transporter substrate-binding protein n=1 Tax=Cryobacterium sp. BB736 TaxID=2746963 RepID=UPI001876DC3E|nr:ABC transporter substrate-binding protein [Cryobacterium sp. BB736]